MLRSAVLLQAACGCTAFIIHSIPPARVAIRMALDPESACVLLPHEPYPGEKPEEVGGEMSLQEMEDSLSSSSQIFLNADGTVGFGATDGPPPLDVCGLWQCGEEGFQMTLQRTFSQPGSFSLTVRPVTPSPVLHPLGCAHAARRPTDPRRMTAPHTP